MTDKHKIDDISGTETTGHEWDGIEELNTPMPRWWLWTFYACILWALVYAILMPSVPLLNSHFKGILGHSDRASIIESVSAMEEERSVYAVKLKDATLNDIREDPDLFRFAMAAGKSAFGDNCATCHGSGAQGFKGYPNLNDDVWIWGGSFEDIRTTLTVGIRAAHENTRTNLMQGYGRDKFLQTEEISDLVHHVRSLSDLENVTESSERGAALYASNCASCHGQTGHGDRLQGAPNLTDREWLYGGKYEDVFETIYGGRQGVMPNWNERLSDEMITALAVYVHSLGGGEEETDDKPSTSKTVTEEEN